MSTLCRMDWAEADKEAVRAVADWWGTVDWGTAPDWLAAVGTVGTLVAALWQLQRERDRARAAEKRERERAERERRSRVLGLAIDVGEGVRFEPTNGPYGGEHVRCAKITVHNGTAGPLVRPSLYDAHMKQIRSFGAIRAGEADETLVPDGHALFPQVWLMFTDAEGGLWLASSAGDLLEAGSEEFNLVTGITPRSRADSPDRVSPQPNAPAPPATAQAEDPPDPGAAS